MNKTLNSYIKGLSDDKLYSLFYEVLEEMNRRKESK